MYNELVLEVYSVPLEYKEYYWNMFYRNHYLGHSLNKTSVCFVGYLWGNPVVFYSYLHMPNGYIKNAKRGHRLVVLPDYQGMGIGNTMSECVGEICLKEGNRFFTKTANVKLGLYRNNSDKWRNTSKNMKRRYDIAKGERNYNNIVNRDLALRLTFSHEYVG